MRKLTILFLTAFILAAMPVASQDGILPEGCDPDGALTIIAELLEDMHLDTSTKVRAIYEVAQENEETCTPFPKFEIGACNEANLVEIAEYLSLSFDTMKTGEEPLQALREIIFYAGYFSAHCEGFVFSSEDIPGKRVIGPVSFAGGFYRTQMTAVDEDHLTVRLNTVSGDCGLIPSFFIVTTAENGDQEIVEIGECVALLEFVPNSSDFRRDAEWEFSLMPVR